MKSISFRNPVVATSKPIHVALLTGCDSHFAVTALVGSALVNYPSVKGKYRVTCVTSANCRDRCEKWGGRLHDTGLWYYPNTDPDISTFEAYRNISKGYYYLTDDTFCDIEFF